MLTIEERGTPMTTSSYDTQAAYETQAATAEHAGPRQNEIITEAFVKIEHWISMGIGGVLVVATVLLLTGTLSDLWALIRQWPNTAKVFLIVDQLLFVLMLVEILHTVRQSISSDQILVEPFLIVGLIASVRRILIVTVEVAGSGKGNEQPMNFNHAMTELAVLGGLTMILIVSIYISRRSRGLRPPSPTP